MTFIHCAFERICNRIYPNNLMTPGTRIPVMQNRTNAAVTNKKDIATGKKSDVTQRLVEEISSLVI
jgi:hypothetical protein